MTEGAEKAGDAGKLAVSISLDLCYNGKGRVMDQNLTQRAKRNGGIMKKVVAGAGFEITGALMLLLSSLIASLNLEKTTEWETRLGRYWQTVFNLGLLPLMIAGAVLLITGIGFSLWGIFSKADQ